MTVEVIWKPKGLLVGKEIGMTQPPAGCGLKGMEPQPDAGFPELPEKRFYSFRVRRRREGGIS